VSGRHTPHMTVVQRVEIFQHPAPRAVCAESCRALATSIWMRVAFTRLLQSHFRLSSCAAWSSTLRLRVRRPSERNAPGLCPYEQARGRNLIADWNPLVRGTHTVDQSSRLYPSLELSLRAGAFRKINPFVTRFPAGR
jgi:hypothetical protein